MEQRSNSRNSGWTSDESETRSPGRAARIAAPRRASCSGFWNAKRRQTATESASIPPSRSTASRTAGIPEGAHHPPARSDPLLHLQPPFPRHEGRRLVAVEVVHVGPDLAPDLEEVAEAGRRQQGHPPAPALDDGVGRHRGPVGEALHLSKRDPGLRKLSEPFDDRPPGVVARRRPLRDPDLSALHPHREEVRERPPDVHPHDPAHVTLGSLGCLSAAACPAAAAIIPSGALKASPCPESSRTFGESPWKRGQDTRARGSAPTAPRRSGATPC